MKSLFFLCVILSGINQRLPAQTHKEILGPTLTGLMNTEEHHLPITEVINHIGHHVYIFDSITGIKIVNDTLKLLYIGGIYPNQILTIIVKGKKVNEDLSGLYNGRQSHFGGDAIMYEGKPAILINNAVQTGIEIQI